MWIRTESSTIEISKKFEIDCFVKILKLKLHSIKKARYLISKRILKIDTGKVSIVLANLQQTNRELASNLFRLSPRRLSLLHSSLPFHLRHHQFPKIPLNGNEPRITGFIHATRHAADFKGAREQRERAKRAYLKAIPIAFSIAQVNFVAQRKRFAWLQHAHSFVRETLHRRSQFGESAARESTLWNEANALSPGNAFRNLPLGGERRNRVLCSSFDESNSHLADRERSTFSVRLLRSWLRTRARLHRRTKL